MFDEEGVVSVRHRLGQVPWAPILSFTHITAGLSHQRLVHEITFATRFTTHSKNYLASDPVRLDPWQIMQA